jgi:hypothetical protein
MDFGEIWYRLGMNMTVFWDVAPCSLVNIINVSEELTASIIKLFVEAVTSSETSVRVNWQTFCRKVEIFYSTSHILRQQG